MEEIKRRFNWKTVVIVVMAFLLVFCLAKINELEGDISNLDNTLANYKRQVSNLERDINSIYTNVDEQLKKEASLLSSVDYALGELDSETHTIPVTVKVVPKTLADDMQLSVQVGNETASFERNGNEFTATFPVGLFISYDQYPMLSILTNGTTQTELMESVYLSDLYTQYLPNVFAYVTPFDDFEKGKLTIDGTLQFDHKSVAITSGVSITKIELITEKNKQEIARTDVTAAVDADHNHVPVRATYDAQYGDEICIYVVAEDTLGYTHKVLAYYWKQIDENTTAEVAVNGSAAIYDKNGNLLTGTE